MSYKISEVVQMTQIPKSTILYYIREGLLPEAKKLKSNVHRYGNEHIELLEYIKYMKQQMGSSNKELKSILQHKNQSLSSSFSMIVPLMQTLSSIPKDLKHYTKQEFLQIYGVEELFLEKLLDDGILNPLKEDDFTHKEATIVHLVKTFQEMGIEYSVLKKYAEYAKAIAQLESRMQKDLCDIRSDANFSILWKIMFETLFNAKEYIFHRATYKVLYAALEEEISKK